MCNNNNYHCEFLGCAFKYHKKVFYFILLHSSVFYLSQNGNNYYTFFFFVPFSLPPPPHFHSFTPFYYFFIFILFLFYFILLHSSIFICPRMKIITHGSFFFVPFSPVFRLFPLPPLFLMYFHLIFILFYFILLHSSIFISPRMTRIITHCSSLSLFPCFPPIFTPPPFILFYIFDPLSVIHRPHFKNCRVLWP